MRLLIIIALPIWLVLCIPAFAGPKPIILDPTYEHDKYNTQPKDIIREFRAYTTSFDSADDNDGDSQSDIWGIPEWVSYQIKKYPNQCIPKYARPSWFTDNALKDQGIAPRDNTYKYSRQWRSRYQDWYVRGHLAMKFIAGRLGGDAAHNTMTLLNAVPQRASFNSGIWQELEYITAAWAQEYDSIWVITGPVVTDRKPTSWLGEEGELPVAIPDGLFKIVIKDSDDSDHPDVLAFLYPQIGASYTRDRPYPHQDHLVSVDELEQLTGLDFLTVLPDDIENEIESEVKEWLWSVENENFIKTCR